MKKVYALGFFLFSISISSFSQSAGDYRTHQAGDWSNTATWERYDGSSWITPAPVTPTDADGLITISHDVSVTADVTADQVGYSNASILTINSGSTLTIANGAGNDLAWVSTSSSVVVNGTLTINSGAVLTGSGGNGAVNGALTVNSGGLINLNGSISGPSSVGLVTTINAGGSMSVSGTGVFSVTRGNGGTLLSISGTVHVANGGAISVNGAGTMAVNNGGTLELEPTALASGNTFTLSSGGNLKIGSTAGIASSGATGNVQSSTRNFNVGANYEYNGTAAQVTGTGFPNNLTGKLTINNPGNAVTLSNARTIASGGSLVLTSGLLTTTSLNLLTFANGAFVTGASDASFVNGPVAKKGNSAFDFPVGKPGGGYHPISISAPSLATDEFKAEYFRAIALSLGPINGGSGITDISSCEYWNLVQTVGSSSVDVKLSWTASSPCGSAYINNPPIGLVVSYFSGTWGLAAGSATNISGNGTAGTVERVGVSAYGYFVIGSVLIGGSPLPVKFGEIKGFRKNSGIQINWTVYTEENVDHYEVERSADGKQFSLAGSVIARNVSGRSDYGWMDLAPLAGTNFYRIRNVDIDGKSTYSIIIRVDQDKSLTGINIYPNPSNGGTITFQAPSMQKGNFMVKVMTTSGQIVYSQKFIHNGGELSQSVPLPAGIQPGIYYLQVQGEERSFQKTFMIQ